MFVEKQAEEMSSKKNDTKKKYKSRARKTVQ